MTPKTHHSRLIFVAVAALAVLLTGCRYRPEKGARSVTVKEPATQTTGGESINPTVCPTEEGLTNCGIGPTNAPPKASGGFRIENLAGSGSRAFSEGTAARASFANPIGIAIARDGSILVADDQAHRIVRISSKGDVTSYAGDGTAGLVNGPVAKARFNRPRGIAVAADGTIFIADTGNHVIRAISPAGQVSTIVGSGKPGFKSAPGVRAQLNAPVGITISADQRSLYVTEFEAHAVRVMSRTGNIVRTLAGTGVRGFKDGPAAAAQFDSPVGVAVNKAGVVFVADAANNRIRKIEKGVVATLAGQKGEGFKNGAGKDAKFNLPYGLTIDGAGNLFTTEFANDSIRKIDPKGVVTTIIVPAGQQNGEPEESPSPSPTPTSKIRPKVEQLTRPAGIVWTDKGTFYVADSGNAKVRLISRK